MTDENVTEIFCHHDKSYAPYLLMTYPSQSPWICRKCGVHGTDRGPFLEMNDYEDVKRRFQK